MFKIYLVHNINQVTQDLVTEEARKKMSKAKTGFNNLMYGKSCLYSNTLYSYNDDLKSLSKHKVAGFIFVIKKNSLAWYLLAIRFYRSY